MKQQQFIILLLLALLSFCKEKEEPQPPGNPVYFPPFSGDEWEIVEPDALGWNRNAIADLYNMLDQNGTRAFIVLVDGKILLEKYFGKRLIGNQDFDRNSLWYWASAGKTLTAALVGIAKEQGRLDINRPSSTYLGAGWTSLTSVQELKITVWHQLTMTTGLDDGVSNSFDYTPSSLLFKAEPGTRWAYHNGPYTLLDKVVANATGQEFTQYFNQQLASKIGMTGSWQQVGFNNVFYSNARSMARFGLLVLADGKWDGTPILKDEAYRLQMTQPSQQLNPSYGYLWWLNGKENFMVPSLQVKFPGSVIPNGPQDMVCGLGKDGQYLCVIPSKNMVLVRLGENPDQALVPFTFLNDIWEKLNKVIR
jgi:CubicO group peptidase (beta-lactamase class C family)